MTQDRSRSAVQ